MRFCFQKEVKDNLADLKRIDFSQMLYQYSKAMKVFKQNTKILLLEKIFFGNCTKTLLW